MKVKLDYRSGNAVQQVKEFELDILPMVGDEVLTPDHEGIFKSAVVISRTFDFCDKEPFVRIEVGKDS
ncbi:MAG: hypothetical protein EOP84_06775 [Verrucomicrobiaceae bacterium]|nr:MAG: hypothetical protein EOP84_06775 [Verrucomicrobiaceae bacterium]